MELQHRRFSCMTEHGRLCLSFRKKKNFVVDIYTLKVGPYSAIFGLKWCVFSLEIISLKPYVVKKSKNSTTYFSYHV